MALSTTTEPLLSNCYDSLFSILSIPHDPSCSPFSPPRTFSSLSVQEIASDSPNLYSNPQKPRSLCLILEKPSVGSGVKKPPPLPDGIGKDKKWVPVSGSSRYWPMEKKEFPEELTPALRCYRLQEDANFSRDGPKEIPATLYCRHFLKSASEKFGQDHQEIAE